MCSRAYATNRYRNRIRYRVIAVDGDSDMHSELQPVAEDDEKVQEAPQCVGAGQKRSAATNTSETNGDGCLKALCVNGMNSDRSTAT